MTTELYYSSVFKSDLINTLIATNYNNFDFVFLPTAHGRELLAINNLCSEIDNLPFFGLEFRHALEFPLVSLPNGMEHDYVKHHRFYFDEILQKGLKKDIKLFTDTSELADDYSKFSGLNFGVLPIPFRQGFLENHDSTPPIEDSKLHLIYVGDPREEKGFHWLPYLVDFLQEDYLKTGKVILDIQASIHTKNSELKCINALMILKSYPPEWIRLHGLDGPLNAEKYYDLIAKGHIMLCPYDKATYRSRSSGTLAEAIAGGIPTIVPNNTWLSKQQPAGTGLTFEGLEDFLKKTQSLIENYKEFHYTAKVAKREWLKKQDSRNLILEVTRQHKIKT